MRPFDYSWEHNEKNYYFEDFFRKYIKNNRFFNKSENGYNLVTIINFIFL